MKLFSSSFLAFLTCLLLTGCEGIAPAWNENAPTVSNAADTQMSKDFASNPTSSRLDSAPGVRTVPDFPVPQDRDLKTMTSKLSGGSVEIYDLDNATQAGAPIASVQPDFKGIPMATDPRVTIYPLDNNGGYPGQYAAAPQQTWPNSILPMGNMTASPAGWDDQPMKISGGRLSPVVTPARSSVYFPYGSAKIDRENNNALSSVAENAKFAPVDRVSVEGFASKRAQTNDPVKAKILNLKESINRAQSVSQNLIEKGVPAEKIKTVGWGDTRPTTGVEESERRVDIITAYGQ